MAADDEATSPKKKAKKKKGAAKGPVKPPSGGLRVAFGVIKGVAITAGFALTVLSLMSLVGLLTGNLWVRLIPALVVGLAPPIVVIERMLPGEGKKPPRGIVTDVLSISWLGFALLFVGVLQPVTRGPLVREGDRYAEAGLEGLARAVYWVAGATPHAPQPDAGEGAGEDGEADAGPATDGGASEGDGGASAEAGAGASDGDGGAAPAEDTAGDGGAAPAAEAGPSDAGAAEEERSELSPAEIFRKAAPSVVTIAVRGPRGAGGGTGFFIDAKGTVVTNNHVIEDAEAVGVKLFDGTWVDETELLVADSDADLALLRVKTKARILPLALGDSEAIEVGQRVVCIGNPLGLEHTLTDGLISARRMWKGRRMVQISAPVSPGNSGGPVISSRGDVIGVATLQIGSLVVRAQNLNLAVPSTAIKALIRDDYPDRRRLEKADAAGPDRW